jgi:hypothetical protein
MSVKHSMQNDQDFLELLQQQAAKQAKLETKRFIPPTFDGITSLIGRYPWQIITFLSALAAVVVTFAGASS